MIRRSKTLTHEQHKNNKLITKELNHNIFNHPHRYTKHKHTINRTSTCSKTKPTRNKTEENSSHHKNGTATLLTQQAQRQLPFLHSERGAGSRRSQHEIPYKQKIRQCRPMQARRNALYSLHQYTHYYASCTHCAALVTRHCALFTMHNDGTNTRRATLSRQDAWGRMSSDVPSWAWHGIYRPVDPQVGRNGCLCGGPSCWPWGQARWPKGAMPRTVSSPPPEMETGGSDSW